MNDPIHHIPVNYNNSHACLFIYYIVLLTMLAVAVAILDHCIWPCRLGIHYGAVLSSETLDDGPN
jgi:hypothetical protein